jgi:hypothetical protein
MKRRFWVWGNSAVRPGHEVYTRPVGQLLRGRTSEYVQGTLLQRGRVLKGAGNEKGAGRRECGYAIKSNHIFGTFRV